MVKRCGYYIENGVIKRKDVYIEWDLGFDRNAKYDYINRLKDALGKELHPILDVTTASMDSVGKSLSPHILKASTGEYMSDLYHTLPSIEVFCYFYFKAISEGQSRYLERMNCLIDVFHNPDTHGDRTQAMWLSLYRLLLPDRQEILQDFNSYSNWLNSLEFLKEV